MKKYILGALLALTMPVLAAHAATPAFSLSGAADGNASVQITGGEFNSPAYLYYFSPSTGTYASYSLGTTNGSGALSTNVNTSTINNLGVNWGMPVYVQVGGYESARLMWPSTGMSSGSGVMFSNTSPSLSINGQGSVTLSGGSGSYYILSNSNSGGVNATISGNTLNLQGSNAGQANIVVCSTGGGCGTLTATVNSSSQMAPTLSSSSLNVNQGGQGSIMLSGGSSPYTVSIPSGSGVSTTLVGNTLYINGNTNGINVINVCSANGMCTPLSVNVQSGATASTNTSTSGQMSFTLPLTMGQATTLQLSGGSGNYYLQTPMSSPALASISGNSLMLNGSAMGSGTVTVCQTGSSTCLPISFTVNQATTATTQTPLTGTGGGWLFDFDLSIGMSNQDVLELQKRLMEGGYFTTTPTGYFGSLTAQAVMKYQAAHGITTTGYVGPMTRAALNR